MSRFLQNFLIVFVVLFGICKCGELCDVVTDVARCGDDFQFPLDLDTNIKRLVIRTASLRNLTKDDFDGYTNLEVIDLSNCGLEYIEPDTFEDLANLKELILSSNKELQISDQDVFLQSNSLVKLNLSEVSIEDINEEFFDGLPNLEEVDLSFTDLNSLTAEVFRNTPKIKILILSKDNRIEINNLCEETNLKQIIQLKAEEQSEIFDCNVQNDENTENLQAKGEVGDEQKKLEDDKKKIEDGKGDHSTVEDTKMEDQIEGDKHLEETESSGDVNIDDNENTKEVKISVNQIDDSSEISTTSSSKSDLAEYTLVDNEKDILKSITTISAEMNNPTTQKLQENDEKMSENVAEEKVSKKNDSSGGQNQDDLKTGVGNSKKSDVLDSLIVIPPEENGDVKVKDKENILLDVGNNIDETKAKASIEDTPPPSSASSGTNIVLGIIVCVMVIGAAGFGYKYWKNHRGYRHTATEEENPEEGKELQTIVAHQPENDEQK